MIALFWLFLALSVSPFKSKNRLAAENAALRHQLIVLQRKVRGRVHLTNGDRLFLVQLYRWFPSVLKTITIIRPETLVRWHRAGFRRYWRWKSSSLGGRPKIAADLRVLIRRMNAENPLWGALCIPSSLDYPQWKTKWNLPCSGPLCGCIKPKEAFPHDEDRFRRGSSRGGARYAGKLTKRQRNARPPTEAA